MEMWERHTLHNSYLMLKVNFQCLTNANDSIFDTKAKKKIRMMKLYHVHRKRTKEKTTDHLPQNMFFRNEQKQMQ